MTCLTCGIGTSQPLFVNHDEQRAHFRADWHRCNVKRKVHGRVALTEDEFERSLRDEGEASSISASESDSDAEDSPATVHRTPELLFVSGNQHFRVWRALLQPDSRHSEQNSSKELTGSVRALRERPGHWAVILSRGGHFAATLFNVHVKPGKGQGKHETSPFEVITHKTFHKYVVRAKAGGRQSAKDATGKSIKSAGSALRRHNEAALTRDIQETMRAWAPQLRECALVFVHAPSANAAPLFHGDAPPLDRGDPRVRSVPFTTRRPTFSETKRVAQTLLTVTASEAPAALPPPPSEPAKPKQTSHPKAQQEQRIDDSAAASQPAEPEVPDSALHAASRSGDADKVAALLQAGEDASVLDARGKPPYAVAANKEVRDAFRRHMASAGESLTWDAEAAGIPSALTPEMEAQQAAKQAEKKAKLREKERERKKRAAERKAKQSEESHAAAEAEVSAAAALAAAEAARLKTGKVKPSKQEQDAAKRREQMAAAAEARIARLQLVSEQQQLW
ncbi:g1077 [Coccomyxa viridis]|uniref:G1077 protein n=1 Tax=Coccomyxa viridis TaxID=1274662 RepID=A0ABP1FK53_9CHLO